MRTATVIDKDLALNLYALPQIVRNMSLAYAGPTASRPDRFDRLEDAWMDLDALVTECLQPPVAWAGIPCLPPVVAIRFGINAPPNRLSQSARWNPK